MGMRLLVLWFDLITTGYPLGGMCCAARLIAVAAQIFIFEIVNVKLSLSPPGELDSSVCHPAGALRAEWCMQGMVFKACPVCCHGLQPAEGAAE
jgi:hypothetical protein